MLLRSLGVQTVPISRQGMLACHCCMPQLKPEPHSTILAHWRENNRERERERETEQRQRRVRLQRAVAVAACSPHKGHHSLYRAHMYMCRQEPYPIQARVTPPLGTGTDSTSTSIKHRLHLYLLLLAL